jgi:hypothetical protein
MVSTEKAIDMQVNLIDGVFNSREAMEILTKLIHVKIKYHEDKIAQNASEEDAKMRESRIKSLQKDLYELRRFVESNAASGVLLHADVKLEKA